MAETIMVTGGAGFIGGHLAEAFVADGHEVLVVDDLSTGKRSNVADGAAFSQLDIRSPEAAALVRDAGVTVLCHQAAQVDVRASVADPRADAQINLLGLLNLLEAGRAAKLERVLFASSGGTVYGEPEQLPTPETHACAPVCPYGVSKRAGELYLGYYQAAYDIGVTCLRYANVYGERQNPHGEAGVVAIFAVLLLDGKVPTIFGDGLQTRDYIHVSDVVAANRAALARAGNGFAAYNVGTGVETNVVELLEALRGELGGPAAQHAEARAGEQRRSCVDAHKIQRDLSVAQPIALRRGLARTAGWFREQHGG